MALIAFLNELSAPLEAVQRETARAAMFTLIAVLREVRKVSGALAFHTPEPLRTLRIAGDYSIPVWLNDGDVREEWRFLLSLQNRSPFEAGLDGFASGALGVEYSHCLLPATGLGWAHLSDGLSISLAFSDTWNLPSIVLDRLTLLELNETDEVSTQADQVEVRHASVAEHVAVHSEWIGERSADRPQDGIDLWRRRDELYPALRFLPRVEGQLRALLGNADQFAAISNRLSELNQAIAEWTPGAGEGPCWRSKVTPEHEGRRNLCNFADAAGNVACYDLHARFTPGHGRIHILLVPDASVCVVGHVGDKLM